MRRNGVVRAAGRTKSLVTGGTAATVTLDAESGTTLVTAGAATACPDRATGEAGAATATVADARSATSNRPANSPATINVREDNIVVMTDFLPTSDEVSRLYRLPNRFTLR
jgi:nucleoid-associated protein YgaU